MNNKLFINISRLIFSLSILMAMNNIHGLKIINNSAALIKVEVKDSHGREFDQQVLDDRQEYIVPQYKLEEYEGPYIIYYEPQKESIAKTIVTFGHRRTRDAGEKQSFQNVSPNAIIVINPEDVRY